MCRLSVQTLRLCRITQIQSQISKDVRRRKVAERLEKDAQRLKIDPGYSLRQTSLSKPARYDPDEARRRLVEQQDAAYEAALVRDADDVVIRLALC